VVDKSIVSYFMPTATTFVINYLDTQHGIKGLLISFIYEILKLDKIIATFSLQTGLSTCEKLVEPEAGYL